MDSFDDIFFLGTAEQSVDNTNRIIMPASFREYLEGDFYLCQGLNDPCIWILPPKVFRSLLRKLQEQISPTASEDQRWVGLITSTAAKKKLDRQYRLSIPPELLQQAGITDKVKIVGHGERAEIWAYDRWYANQINFHEKAVEMNEKYNLKGYAV